MNGESGMNTYERQPVSAPDMEAYIQRLQTGACFICGIVSGNADGNHVIYQDNTAVVFLNK